MSLIPSADKPKIVAQSEEHKKLVLRGVLKTNDFQPGDSVWSKADKRLEGSVIDVLDFDSWEMIEWDRLRPKFVEVFWYATAESTLHNPSELEKL